MHPYSEFLNNLIRWATKRPTGIDVSGPGGWSDSVHISASWEPYPTGGGFLYAGIATGHVFIHRAADAEVG